MLGHCQFCGQEVDDDDDDDDGGGGDDNDDNNNNNYKFVKHQVQ